MRLPSGISKIPTHLNPQDTKGTKKHEGFFVNLSVLVTYWFKMSRHTYASAMHHPGLFFTLRVQEQCKESNRYRVLPMILIEYTLTLHSKSSLLCPINWIFTHTFWRSYMKHALENIRQFIAHEEDYQFE